MRLAAVPRTLRRMRMIVAVVSVMALVAAACSSASDQPNVTIAPPAAVSDEVVAWCGDFNNFPAIAEAAIAARVDGYELIEAERAKIIDRLGEAYLEAFLGGFLELEWRPGHEVGYAAACAAAFESR